MDAAVLVGILGRSRTERREGVEEGMSSRERPRHRGGVVVPSRCIGEEPGRQEELAQHVCRPGVVDLSR